MITRYPTLTQRLRRAVLAVAGIVTALGLGGCVVDGGVYYADYGPGYDYLYYPARGIYYDQSLGYYYYPSAGTWVQTTVLPTYLYRGLGSYVVLTNPGPRPWYRYDEHRHYYPPQSYRHHPPKPPPPKAKPYWDKPPPPRAKPYWDKPAWDGPKWDQPKRDRPKWDKPKGDQPKGDNPSWDNPYWVGQRPGDDKPPPRVRSLDRFKADGNLRVPPPPAPSRTTRPPPPAGPPAGQGPAQVSAPPPGPGAEPGRRRA